MNCGQNRFKEGENMAYEMDSILIPEDQLKQKVKEIGAQMS
jgi:hypothetical protein